MAIQRKIEFFELIVKEIDSGLEKPFKSLKEVLGDALKLSFQEKKWIPSNNKFVYLDSFKTENDIQFGYLTCGLTRYRPDLVDGEDGDKRENPKTESEGDEERCHFAIKYKSNQVILMVEFNGKGIPPNKAGYYLGILTDKVRKVQNKRKLINVVCRPIPIDDVDSVVKGMNKARVIELFIDKRILGSDFLNLTDRAASVRQEITITVKTTRERSSNIKETAQDIYNAYGTNNTIKRLRISGNDSTNLPFQIDTSILEKKTYISVDENLNKGTVNTTDVLRKLKELAETV